MIRYIVITICFSFILSPLANAQITLLYGSANAFNQNTQSCGDGAGGGDSTLYRINPRNGKTTEIGSIGFRGVTGMAFLGDGRLVASAQDDVGQGPDRLRVAILIEIDPQTGQGSLIGQIGDDDTIGECGRAPDLTYDSATDTLYAMGIFCPDEGGLADEPLMIINQATGLGSILNFPDGIGFGGSGYGLAINGNGTMFTAAGSDLVSINPLTGVGTFAQNISAPSGQTKALSYHPLTGQLFGTNGSETSNLLTLNTDDGSTDVIGELPQCFDALAFSPPIRSRPIPTLSEWGLIAMAGVLGIIGLLALRRRKVAA